MLKKTNHVGSDVSENEVPEPVGGSGKGDTLSTNGERVDLSDHDPGSGTPGGGEAKDVEADEDDQAGVGSLGSGKSSSDGTDNKLADQHPDGTPDEKLAATELLDTIESDGGGNDVDQVGDERDQERVFNAGLLEEGRSVVEDEVDTSQLLEHLKANTDEDTAEVARRRHAHEAVDPASLRDATLILVVGLDLRELIFKVVGVDGLASETRQGSERLLTATFLHVPTGRLGEEEESDSENESPDELDGDRNTVRGKTVPLVGSLVDTGSKKKTEGDGPLISCNNGTTDALGSNLRHIHDLFAAG
jgi:hypothetical protein